MATLSLLSRSPGEGGAAFGNTRQYTGRLEHSHDHPSSGRSCMMRAPASLLQPAVSSAWRRQKSPQSLLQHSHCAQVRCAGEKLAGHTLPCLCSGTQPLVQAWPRPSHIVHQQTAPQTSTITSLLSLLHETISHTHLGKVSGFMNRS